MLASTVIALPVKLTYQDLENGDTFILLPDSDEEFDGTCELLKKTKSGTTVFRTGRGITCSADAPVIKVFA